MEINKTQKEKKTINDIIIFVICLIIAFILIYYHRIKYILFITTQYNTRNIAILILILITIIVLINGYYKYKEKFSE